MQVFLQEKSVSTVPNRVRCLVKIGKYLFPHTRKNRYITIFPRSANLCVVLVALFESYHAS